MGVDPLIDIGQSQSGSSFAEFLLVISTPLPRSEKMYEETRVYTTTTRQEYVPTFGTSRPEIDINLDLSYLQTLPGLLKCLQIAFDFLCFICVLIGGPGYYAGVGWATFVSVFGFIITLTLLMLYLFHIVDTLEQIPWIVGVKAPSSTAQTNNEEVFLRR